ncbi:DNA recombination protein RmuC [Psychromonas antarctica]|jgi:DNA recombination protein RmuC|uniref:DNA recombination protein RmuC n=1 Tax=Psychromonas antarctica TaxID=67573 RepID=UPI001EE8B051|nr:DNA recombination protein RmuC [Psychromonas antarctica]MCG6200712.1 DNA recombination protein RmuC [Psychromonas antarctica]
MISLSNEATLYSLLAAIVLLTLLSLYLYIHFQQIRSALNLKLELSEQALHFQMELNLDKEEQLQEKQLRIDSLQLQVNKLTTRIRESEVRLQSGEQRLRDQQLSEEKLGDQFELLSQRIFNDKSAQFKALNQDSLNQLLSPLKVQLEGFKQQVSHFYLSESKERYNLQNEVSKLAKLNELMQQETSNLTNALKGDNKQQGNWGEVILQRILESSGLREGHEYHTQSSFKNDNGDRLQPDVIVNLPKNKNIIIDSKVSLVAYERFFNADSTQTQQEALQAHILSVRQHIKGLGKKDYQKLIGTNSLDYILLFVAVEPAFIAAIEHDRGLVKLALDNNILLASPTNLMIALRTIENLWRFEQQEKNGRLIAKQAGKLYDKLRLFTQNLLDLGAQLGKAQSSYDHALKQLSQGQGNIISQAENLKEMGAPIKKSLPDTLVAQANLLYEPSDAKNDG